MGKASKWIKNFLVRKKEEKIKKQDFSTDVISIESFAKSLNTILPKEKKSWSFRKSKSSQNDFVLKSLKSFDSIVNSQKLANALMKYNEDELQVGFTKPIVQDKQDLLRYSAATKIQASFRSYLARKALCALRALVKLQALVRGYLVRKRTTTTLRCMHALISIQVRARVQRISFSDETQSSFHDQNGQSDLVIHKEAYNEKIETIIGKNQVILHTKSFSRDRSKIKQIVTGLEDFPPKLQENRQELNVRTSSSLSYISTRQNNPKAKRTKQNVLAHFSGPLLGHSMPNYMANTESSRAKARSHSAPKQRLQERVKQISRRSASIERSDFDAEDLVNSSSSLKKNQHRWLTKLYRSAKGVAKESEYDSTSITTDSSNNSRSMMPYEPHVDLY